MVCDISRYCPKPINDILWRSIKIGRWRPSSKKFSNLYYDTRPVLLWWHTHWLTRKYSVHLVYHFFTLVKKAFDTVSINNFVSQKKYDPFNDSFSAWFILKLKKKKKKVFISCKQLWRKIDKSIKVSVIWLLRLLYGFCAL